MIPLILEFQGTNKNLGPPYDFYKAHSSRTKKTHKLLSIDKNVLFFLRYIFQILFKGNILNWILLEKCIKNDVLFMFLVYVLIIFPHPRQRICWVYNNYKHNLFKNWNYTNRIVSFLFQVSSYKFFSWDKRIM